MWTTWNFVLIVTRFLYFSMNELFRVIWKFASRASRPGSCRRGRSRRAVSGRCGVGLRVAHSVAVQEVPLLLFQGHRLGR